MFIDIYKTNVVKNPLVNVTKSPPLNLHLIFSGNLLQSFQKLFFRRHVGGCFLGIKSSANRNRKGNEFNKSNELQKNILKISPGYFSM